MNESDFRQSIMGVFSKKPATKIEVPTEDFDPNSDHYKCCCRQLHIITGAKIVAIMYVVIVSIHLITASINYSKIGGLYTALFSKALVNFIFCIIAVVFLFYALRTSKRIYIIPMLVYQIIFGVVMIIFIILMVKALARSGKYLWELSHLVGHVTNPNSATTQNTMDQESKLVVTVLLGIILLLVCVFALLMDIRYFFVIYILFKFYRDKDVYEKVRNEPPPTKADTAISTAIVMLDDNNPYERKPPQYSEVSV